MLQALRPEDALAIAEVSRRRSRDEQAMAQHLGIGRGARANGAPPDGTPLGLAGDVDLAAFESEERRRLEAAIAQLSPDARRELIALIWLVQRPLLSFEAALRRTRRIPPAAQPGYLMGIRLERYIADGLRKLGCRGSWPPKARLPLFDAFGIGLFDPGTIQLSIPPRQSSSSRIMRRVVRQSSGVCPHPSQFDDTIAPRCGRLLIARWLGTLAPARH